MIPTSMRLMLMMMMVCSYIFYNMIAFLQQQYVVVVANSVELLIEYYQVGQNNILKFFFFFFLRKNKRKTLTYCKVQLVFTSSNCFYLFNKLLYNICELQHKTLFYYRLHFSFTINAAFIDLLQKQKRLWQEKKSANNKQKIGCKSEGVIV